MVNEEVMRMQQMHYVNHMTGGNNTTNSPEELNNIYGNDLSYQAPKTHEYPLGLPPQIDLSEAYKYFIEAIKEGRQFKYFYKQLITLRRDILLDISNRNQGLVAKDLNINSVKMSAIVAMLKETDVPQLHVTNSNA